MSILIKGMEIPKGCYECRLLEGDKYDGFCHGADRWLDDDYFRWYVYPEGDIDDTKPVNCPLDEVPTPHGRLIDADKMEKEVCGGCKHGEHKYSNCIDCALANAPTVIEAEGEK